MVSSSFFLSQMFYAKEIDEDERRVKRLFREASKNGIAVHKRYFLPSPSEPSLNHSASARGLSDEELFDLASRPRHLILVLLNKVTTLNVFVFLLLILAHFCFSFNLFAEFAEYRRETRTLLTTSVLTR